MRSFLFVLTLLGFSACTSPDLPELVMCHDPSTAIAEFASFASDKDFRDAHPAPQAVNVVHAGKMVEFPVEGGANGKAFLIKPHGKSNKYLLLFHEWWGLNDYVKNEAAMWSHELGINVLAVDLYDGQVAATPEEAGKFMQANDPARSIAIIRGAAAFAGPEADFRTMGWCFGGGWSLQAALALGDKTKGCVMFYGMPEKDVAKLKTLASDVVFIHATQDQWINDEVVAGFEKNMVSAGKKLNVYFYNADHAFANPSGPRYNEKAAIEARTVVSTYLRGK